MQATNIAASSMHGYFGVCRGIAWPLGGGQGGHFEARSDLPTHPPTHVTKLFFRGRLKPTQGVDPLTHRDPTTLPLLSSGTTLSKSLHGADKDSEKLLQWHCTRPYSRTTITLGCFWGGGAGALPLPQRYWDF